MGSIRCLLLLSVTICCAVAVCSHSTGFVASEKRKLRILGVFGHLGRSHFDVFKPLLEELARRGHVLTVVSHFPRNADGKADEFLPNYRDVSLRNSTVGIFADVVDLTNVKHSFMRPFHELTFLRNMGTYACEVGLRNPNVRQFLRSDEKFDVILTETFNTDCFLGFVHRFGAPFIGISTHQLMPWTGQTLGVAEEFGQIPTVLLGFVRPMNFFQRAQNFLVLRIARVLYDTWYLAPAQAIAKEVFGPGVPNLRDIARNMSGLLINTHYTLHGSTPLPPSVYEIGGLHIPNEQKPLPEDIGTFLDEAQEGVLYFNMGSMIKASSVPKDKLDVILSVIGSIPRKVIWKFEAEELPGRPANVMIRKWLPQVDILRHPNVRCYLGHGGLLGLSEGVYVGVPMILMPIFGDQFHNAAAAATRGVALVLDYAQLDEKHLRDAIDQLFNNSRYTKNVKLLSKAYRDRASDPMETAIWFTEHIARGNNLRYLPSETSGLCWWHNFDVVLFFLLLALLNVYLAQRLLCFLVHLLLARGTKERKSLKTD